MVTISCRSESSNLSLVVCLSIIGKSTENEHVQIHVQKEEAMFADIPLWRKVLQFCSAGAAAAGARLT